jgi:predicted ribosome quality control (RQC) complex YloA/Tae2 family protein
VSLNWREIDLLLSELDLAGSLIQQIQQPTHDTLVFELRARSGGLRLLLSLSNRNARLHRQSEPVANPARPPRFASFLRAHVRGGRIVEASQVADQRIVRLAIRRGDDERLLWIRLWPTAANVIATTPDGTILETFYRRPNRGEVAGGSYDPGAQAGSGATRREFTVRELPGEGDFNDRVERHYREAEEREEADRLRGALLAGIRARENRVLVQRERLRAQMLTFKDPERQRQLGDIIMANLHRIPAQADRLEAEDFHRDGSPVVIELDPRLSGPRNAERYYDRASAARTGGQRVSEEMESIEKALEQIAAQKAALEGGLSLEQLRALRPEARRRRRETVLPGLHFDSSSHRIMVGRTAADNDALLRSHVGGNDYWFHVRDWPGAYVFVKTPKGKSVPLEVMLDAANLALFYSKGRAVGSADIYYTQVRFLRRARGGRKGLVIPTREKNLFVRLDTGRVERVRQSQVVE